MTKDKRQSSPRGLITNITPAEPSDEELRPQPASELLSFWREFARGIIEASNKNPDDYLGLAASETLDHVCAAARLMKQLDKVYFLIGHAKRDPKRFLDAALGEAVLLSSLVHQLTIADNETHIWKGEEQNKTLRQNAANKTTKGNLNRERYQSKADQIWKRHPDWKATDVARAIEHDERREREKAEKKSEFDAQGRRDPPKDLQENNCHRRSLTTAITPNCSALPCTTGSRSQVDGYGSQTQTRPRSERSAPG